MFNFGAPGGPRLGNQLFQYASLIGLAKTHNTKVVLPDWKYKDYFEGEFPTGSVDNARLIQEPTFEYVPYFLQIFNHDNVDIKGYLQSEFYWYNAKEEVKKVLTFKQEFKDTTWNNFMRQCKEQNPKEKKTIAISIRRGDYVGNPNYVNLPITYFIGALFERFPDWQEQNIIIFSDDIPWTRIHFGCLDNVFFSENNSEIEDLCLMSQCDSFILANSTFSFWGAYLAELQRPVKVVRPNNYFAGRLAKENDERDLYPKRWQVYDHLDENGHNKKINLKDTSFQIPLYFDHQDRKENLDIVLKAILDNFDTEIMVTEQGGDSFAYVGNDYRIKYFKEESTVFHRTKMLNDMARTTDKKYIFNYDADILIAPLQLWKAVDQLRKGAEMVYPYDGRFARIPRTPWMDKLRSADIGVVGDTQFNGMMKGDAVSLGGCVAWNKFSFFEYGGENEKFCSYNPEDVERYERAVKLGVTIERTNGPMFHINHFVGQNSNTSNPFYPAGRAELERIRSMSADQLLDEISTWPWSLDSAFHGSNLIQK